MASCRCSTRPAASTRPSCGECCVSGSRASERRRAHARALEERERASAGLLLAQRERAIPLCASRAPSAPALARRGPPRTRAARPLLPPDRPARRAALGGAKRFASYNGYLGRARDTARRRRRYSRRPALPIFFLRARAALSPSNPPPPHTQLPPAPRGAVRAVRVHRHRRLHHRLFGRPAHRRALRDRPHQHDGAQHVLH